MKNITLLFNRVRKIWVRSPAERALIDAGCLYSKLSNGGFLVADDLNLSYLGLTELPDLSRVIVMGRFHCDNNKLTSLRGSPKKVEGTFTCYNNRLTTLDGAPESVKRFICKNNPDLTSLKSAPYEFASLETDFGDFRTRGDIPSHLLGEVPPPSLPRKTLEEKIATSTVLQKPVRLIRKIKTNR